MKIAVIEDEANHIASLMDVGTFNVYESGDGRWNKLHSFVNEAGSAEGISQIHSVLEQTVRQLENVRILVSTKIPGIATSHFETAGIGVFIVERSTMDAYRVSITDVLNLIDREVPDIIREAERQQAETQNCASGCGSCHSGCASTETAGQKELDFAPYTGRSADGVVTFDMVKALAENPGEISKTVLIPFVKQAGEAVLEVHCAHIPRWFDTELKALGYTYLPVSVQEDDVTVRLTFAE